MDEFYSKGNAGDTLAQLIQDRNMDSRFYLSTCEFADLTVNLFSQPRAWRLCSETGQDSTLEEACFKVQGVLCGKDLPPVNQTGSRLSRLRSRKFIRQYVKVTGFGNEDMLQCVKRIEMAYLKMSDHFKEGTVEPWQPSLFEGYVALEANTRYFTHTNHANPGDIVDFAPHVDSGGRLKDIMEGEYVHTTDNRVDYLERVTGPDGETRYRVVDPVIFKSGDIVEAVVAFAIIPTKKNTAKLHLLLRGLVLLDQTERNSAAIMRMRNRYRAINIGQSVCQPVGQPSLKRKLMFYDTDPETEETGRQFTRMRVDSDAN
ncbi:hypothetical protein MD484_g4827, partial [Candolleomyces efflorescens]